MSTLETVFLVFGALATVIFVVGYVRGARIAIATYDADTVEVDDSRDVQHFWWQIAAAVATASVVIGLVGVIPEFVYVGPALAIFTAAMNGVAFFLEKAPEAES
jgi:ABC-type proline/glycine betaine transport system permease subunit